MQDVSVPSMFDTRVETRNFSLRPGEAEMMRDRLGTLSSTLGPRRSTVFRAAIFYLVPAQEYLVKCRLRLPGRLMVTGEHDSVVIPPFERCVDKLVKKIVWEFQRRAGNDPWAQLEQSGARYAATGQTGPLFEFLDQEDLAILQKLARYRKRLSRRVRGWVARHTRADWAVQDWRLIRDLVEEIILTILQRARSRPASMPLGDWIDIHVDVALRSMLTRPDVADESLGYLWSLQELAEGRIQEQEGRRARTGR